MNDTGKTSSRSAILAAIRSANAAATPARRPGEREPLPREYVRSGNLAAAELLTLFEHRLVEYDAQLFRTSVGGIASTVQQRLLARNKKKFVIPTGLSGEWLPAGFEFERDGPFSFDALDRFDGVITAATVAVAATGSIALQHGPAEGRRALSLIPDYHLCVVFADQVVETLPQAFDRLNPIQPTTFISGPSATADIEMTRIKGVHGPRFLDVLLINE